jgi:Raf kinase inhibitor-like YbhB/YbcL family protein
MTTIVLAAVLIVSPACARGPQASPPITEEGTMAFSISSPAFEQGRPIPPHFTADGDDVSPDLTITGVPDGAASLALIMDDPDAPMGTWVHWVVWNISADTAVIEEGTEPDGSTGGRNSWGRTGYGGPAPPSGTHRYFFKLFALDTVLDLSSTADKAALESAMKEHILDRTELMGTYAR